MMYRPILDVYTLLHFGQTKVWNEDDWDAAHSVCLLRLSFAASCLSDSYLGLAFHTGEPPQWGAADAEIKVPSGENTELKRSAFKAGSRSVYIHTCYAYCHEFLSCLFLPFQSIHLHLKLSGFFPALAVANTGSCVGPQNKIGHPAGCRFPC